VVGRKRRVTTEGAEQTHRKMERLRSFASLRMRGYFYSIKHLVWSFSSDPKTARGVPRKDKTEAG